MAAKYSKRQIWRNRMLAVLALAAVVVIIIAASASCGAGGTEDYAETGPSQADENTVILTGRDAYDYSSPVPESYPVADSYFSESIFIGQSHVGGMRMFTDAVPTADICYFDSASVANGIDQAMNFSGEQVPLSEILNEKTYQNIYLHFGLNELGFSAKSAFYTYYSSLVAEIRELQPNAAIYLMSVLPVSAQVNSAGVYTIEGVGQYNVHIRRIAEENRIFYLDIAAPFTGADGYIDPAATDNGINLKIASYAVWREYLLTHTAPGYAR